jgi:hypothetical protein
MEAIYRIEAALARIERALDARDGTGARLAESFAALEERHDLLRARVGEIVGRLDALIAAEGR